MSRQAVLAVLERASSDTNFLAELAERQGEALKGYELDSQEAAVLASGDVRALEEWFGKLDERLLIWTKCGWNRKSGDSRFRALSEHRSTEVKTYLGEQCHAGGYRMLRSGFRRWDNALLCLTEHRGILKLRQNRDRE